MSADIEKARQLPLCGLGGRMSIVGPFVKRHPAATYFAITFAISWGGVIITVGPGGFPGTPAQVQSLLPLAILAMLAGPIVAAHLMIGIVDGLAGLRALRSQLFRWNVGARWYAIALLTAPLLMLAVLAWLSLFSSTFLPAIVTSTNRTSLMLAGLVTAVAAGFIEEVGWTGFATPQLRRRHGVVATGLIVGFVWAAWHLLVGYWASGTVQAPLSLTSFLLDPFLFLVAYRVLIVWVFDRTGSLLVAMLMHVGQTFTVRVVSAPNIAGAPLLIVDTIWAVLVLAIAARAIRTSGSVVRGPTGNLKWGI